MARVGGSRVFFDVVGVTAGVLPVFLSVTKQRMGKQPFADQMSLFAEFVVDRKPNLTGKMEIQVIALRLPAMTLQQGRQGPQLNGRVNMEAERHIDKRYLERHGPIVSTQFYKFT